MCAPATVNVLFGKPPGKLRSPPPQMTEERPFSSSASPSVTMTTVRTDACSIGRMSTRSSATPPANAITRTIGNAAQNESPRFMSDHAMNVVNVAISPWAKLMTRVVR
jgi:hypothetical protein